MQKDNLTVEQAARLKEYNDVPVIYCKNCLSLKILTVDGMDYCDNCGSTDMAEAHIGEWEKLYAAKYVGKYLDM